MKALLFKDKKIVLTEKARPVPAEKEVLLQINMTGICSTDIALLNGYYGFEGIAGHETIGTVVESRRHKEWLGKRVTVEINCGCGKCVACVKGNEKHCPDRSVIGILGRDGAFAEFMTAPVRNLHKVDDSIPTERAIFTEPLAAALQIARQIHIKPNRRIAALGDGKLGLLIALTLTRFCHNVFLIGKYPHKLQIAQSHGVHTIQLERDKTTASELVNEFGLFDIVIDAAGNAQAMTLAIDLVKPEGVIVAKTTTHQTAEINFSKIVTKEITVIGSRCGDFNQALYFLKNQWIDVSPLIEAIYPFSEFEQALHKAQEKGAKKILLSFDKTDIPPPPSPKIGI